MTGETRLTGVILAGGLGRRMGGADKGLQLLDGQALVQRVLERFAPQVDELLLNANQNLARYQAFGYPVVADQLPGFAGPLAGLQVAMAAASHPLVATVPCDSPFLPVDLVTRLRAALLLHGADVATARTSDQRQPAFCVCRRALLPQLSSFLANGGRKLDWWQRTLKAVEVSFDDQPEAFRNINTAEELANSGSRAR
ncbi:MAG TPA: molybdenum cofactor guanylyltransferase MobA [Accumulibacter sp.]|uniref:molybdenum cofactor guanylyltransferase MobA n=1 Tax=Accumulibacter sp. TaxID=2053492 RepID=UPI000EC29833|nr:molybdenum cofactor guanylyltransferase MobA [Accumulibacter sp.]HCZ15267.1 molybdenum cofactor guanylyltransferase MobA [Accumulibacter sp.]HRF73059.1 molybdenum cofactor guanylyltransferase MobA [Accumulibacter sp.]